MKLRYKYTKQFVGIFLLISILAVVLALTFILINKKVLEKKYIFRAKFSNAIGLSAVTPVYFKGFMIGNITDFYLTEDNYIEAKFEVYENYRNKIVLNSALNKAVNPVTSSSTIEFLQGEGSLILLPEGSLIPDVNVPEGQLLLSDRKVIKLGDPLSSIVDNLRIFSEALTQDNNADRGSVFRALVNLADATDEMKNLLKNLNRDLSVANENYKSPINQTVQNLATLTSNLNEMTKTLNLTFKRMDTLLANYSRPEGLVEKIIDPSGENIVKPLRKTIENFAKLTAEMNNFTYYINSQSANLTLTIQELKNTLNQVQKVFEGINRSFFQSSDGRSTSKYSISKERIRLLDLEK